MASKKISAAQLPDAIKSILDEYAGEIEVNINEITAKVTKEGAKVLRAESKQKFKDVKLKRGRYGTGWTTQMETGRFSAQGTIYNKKYPGLPHLLEHGHANRGGGRTPGKLHIDPVEKLVIENYEKVITNELERNR